MDRRIIVIEQIEQQKVYHYSCIRKRSADYPRIWLIKVCLYLSIAATIIYNRDAGRCLVGRSVALPPSFYVWHGNKSGQYNEWASLAEYIYYDEAYLYIKVSYIDKGRSTIWISFIDIGSIAPMYIYVKYGEDSIISKVVSAAMNGNQKRR